MMQTEATIQFDKQCRLTAELEALNIRWVHQPAFEFSNSVHQILESDVISSPDDLVSTQTHFDMSILQVDLLTADEERALFTRMNCLRYLAASRRNRAISEGPRPIDVRTVKNLLEEADAARDRIANANQRLVLKIASGFRSNRDDTQDLIGEASLVLIKAIDGFDVSRGFRFSTYATHAIQRHLSRVWKRNLNRRLITNGREADSVRANNDQPWVDAELEAMVPTLMEELTQRERRLVQMRFGIGGDGRTWTYRELGEELGLSPERIRQIVLRACTELRKQYSHSVGID